MVFQGVGVFEILEIRKSVVWSVVVRYEDAIVLSRLEEGDGEGEMASQTV